uniref:photosystem I assembly protein Ycf4 n=1 Tax=Timspurckia oligopyrenoides TaxID=708627 RepID=UPI001FCD61ED|nr:photosystem I assembly protein Ycf4 [Timspurckia oligopyrenoides]UNJ17427.1 photosystem I assembly protein Ycf4 [Timspurckia oligopyrenoides]
MVDNVQESNKLVYQITGSRRLSNYWWAIIISLGGTGFLGAGLSSYYSLNLLPFLSAKDLLFIPQGVVMTFYGTVAIFLSLFLWLTILWNVGSGYNEFNKDQGYVEIFRVGFPGKNRTIRLVYKLNDIKSIKVNINEGLNPKREIYLFTKNKQQIPITRIGQPMSLSDLENQASEIAQFLSVNIEGLV